MTFSPDLDVASVQGTLALDFGRGVRSTRGPDLRLVHGDRLELEGFAHRFASAVVEVMGGDRGPSQLLRWTSESVYADLCHRVGPAPPHHPQRPPHPPAAQPGAEHPPLLPLARALPRSASTSAAANARGRSPPGSS